MHRTLFLPLVVLALLVATRASAIEITRLQAPVTIDGDLSDSAWQSAPPIDSFVEYMRSDNGAPPAKTVARIAYDDEALYLADRLILMTDGPAATVGETMAVPFDRPRSRAAVLADARYHACRRHVIDFLDGHAKQSRAARWTHGA